MYYVCIENGTVTSVLNYYPNVPSTITVIQITEFEYESIISGASVFDVDILSVRPLTDEEQSTNQIKKDNISHEEFLNSTDWKVLRHIREKALGKTTTLTDDEYLKLEEQRELAAKSIV